VLFPSRSKKSFAGGFACGAAIKLNADYGFSVLPKPSKSGAALFTG